jgi:hypothetical protein
LTPHRAAGRDPPPSRGRPHGRSALRSGNDVARLAAIAVIRTFLNYFLERDLAEIRERQHEQPKGA